MTIPKIDELLSGSGRRLPLLTTEPFCCASFSVDKTMLLILYIHIKQTQKTNNAGYNKSNVWAKKSPQTLKICEINILT